MEGLSEFAGSLDFGAPDSMGLPDFSQYNPGQVAYSPQPDFGGMTPDAPGGGGGGLLKFGSDVMSGAGKMAGSVGKAFSDDPLSSFAKTLGLGSTAFGVGNQFRMMGQLNDQTNSIKKAQKSAEAAAAPAVAAGTADINRAQAGKLQPAQEASIAQWVQKAKADMRARYAQMGQGNSSNITSEDQKIELMAESMKGQLLQGEESLGLQGVQTGVSAATGAGQLSQQQQSLLANLIASANQQLGLLAGRSGGQ